jgi:pSer/pThr/pTyr-binding forkhead associated (FHA) protein
MTNGKSERVSFRLTGAEPTKIPLRLGQHVVGRSADCEVVVDDATVSRRHATIQVTAHCVSVFDLNSRNGIFVNELRVRESILQQGDCVCFGRISFLFHRHPPILIRKSLSTEPSTAELRGLRIDTATLDVSLSPARNRVLFHLLRGLAEKEIGAKLNISVHTVHNHVRQIYQHFGVNSRAELLAAFLKCNDDSSG